MNEALGWTLFHFIWEGASVALLLAVLLVLCHSSKARYAAACGAMMAMLAAFGVTLVLKLPANGAGSGRVHILAGPIPQRPLGVAADGIAAAERPYRWAVTLWLAGVLLLSLHRLVGVAAASRLRRTGVRPAPAPWPVRLQHLISKLGLHRSVLLLESSLTDVPVAVGYLRPAILFPAGLLTGLPAEQVEFILIHELAHIARRDYLVNLLQCVVEALLFYHPAVWWVSSVVRAEREHCCDDAVVAVGGDACTYAATLVTLEQSRVTQPLLAATGGSLTKRVHRLLRQPATSQVMAIPLATAALALVIAGAALAASQAQQVSAPAPAQATAPYQKWLNEDVAHIATDAWLNEEVVYIISDAEREAFERLSTVPEREHFIEQFWERRDPTPGTPANEFKAEHYRRIAYANAHFAAPNLAGWKSDRGRIYIVYGPPDELEDHNGGGQYRQQAPAGGSIAVYPFQQWRYAMIQGMGKNVIIEFVDANRTGEYRMTTDPNEKQAPPTANSNGRLKVSVSGKLVTMTMPFASAAKYTVSVRIMTPARRVVTSFGEPATGPLWMRTISLAPGSYRLDAIYKNIETGEIQQETETFVVN